ncbi:Uncharacterised protein [uncultured archaeon]|nr:Uncharacterised protein [uncultured archaeon]
MAMSTATAIMVFQLATASSEVLASTGPTLAMPLRPPPVAALLGGRRWQRSVVPTKTAEIKHMNMPRVQSFPKSRTIGTDEVMRETKPAAVRIRAMKTAGAV